MVAEKLKGAQSAQEAGKAGKQGKAAGPPLQELLAVGQLVRCVIVGLHDKDSSDGVLLVLAPFLVIDVCAPTEWCMAAPAACSDNFTAETSQGVAVSRPGCVAACM